MNPTLLILAAGLGSRYGGVKQMAKVGPSGESIIDYSIYDAMRAGFGKVVFVINKKIEADFKEIFEPKLKGRIQTEYVLQEMDKLPQGFTAPEGRVKPWGTAHAILVAREAIQEPFAVINADDFYGAGSYQILSTFFKQAQTGTPEFCMAGFNLAKTISDSGTVSRGVCKLDENDYLLEVTECEGLLRKEGKTGYYAADKSFVSIAPDKTVSMNCWGFTPDIFPFLEEGFITFLSENIHKPKAEYYIPTLITNLIKSAKAKIKVIKSTDQWFGVTYPQDKPLVIENINKLVAQKIYPTKLWN